MTSLDLTRSEWNAVDRVVKALNVLDISLGHLSVNGRARLARAIVRDMPGLVGNERAHLLAYFQPVR